MADLSKYRLPDNDDKQWMLEAMHNMGFDRYMNFEKKVFDALDRLQPGKFYDITEVAEDRQELFVKLGCIYIQTHPAVVFSNDYSKIERTKYYEQWKLEIERNIISARKHK